MIAVMTVDDLVFRRFRAFIEQFRDSHGRGWQPELQRLTGLSRAALSHYANGIRSPSAPTVRKVAQAVGIDSTFFFGDREDDGHFKDFPVRQQRARIEPDAAYPALDDFLATPSGSRLPDACVEYLRGIRFAHGDPTPHTYLALAREWEDRQLAFPKTREAPELEATPSRGRPLKR